MIASPGDVASERAIIRDVVYEWNAIHSNIRNIVLLPIGWESHSSPDMSGSPQEVINKQILEKCDFLVGVFWTRLGTPTKNYDSGTVEEIERYVKSKKPVMLYFSSQPVAMESVNLDQYTALTKFKESCQKRGLFEVYDSHSEFKEKFFRQLQIKLNEHELFNIDKLEVPNNIVESNTQLPTLTNEARILLKETSLDSHGHILYMRYLNGNDIQVNDKNMLASNGPREVAKWEAALHELVEGDLLIERGNKGEIFEITNLGYQIADMIEL